MHGLRALGQRMRVELGVARVAISHVTIPRVAHDKLHEACIFDTTRKRGSRKHERKHVTGIFKDLSWCNAWTRV